MQKYLFACSFLILFAQSGFGQIDLNQNTKAAYADIIALRFNDARQKLNLEKDRSPRNLMIPYLENYMDFLTVFIGEDKSEFDFLEKNKNERVDLIRELDDSSPYRNYMLGNIHLQWAVARLKFKEYFTAALEINKSYRLLKRNSEEFPGFIPNNITMGVLHIMIGMVPEKYQWLLDLISMEGSVAQGREELYMVLNHSAENETYRHLQSETLFYLGFVELNIQPDQQQIQKLLTLLESASSDNLLLSYLQINILMRTGRNPEAIKVFQGIEASNADYLPFYYLDYLYGECFLRDLKTIQANINYDAFLSNFKGRNFIKDALRKKAWIALLEGDEQAYLEQLSTVGETGHDDVDIDQEAEREALSGSIPNPDLVRARLLFDGGYYARADSVLTQIDTTGLAPEMQLERSYRKARISHESGDIPIAKDWYLNTIEEGSNSPRYYAGNACLKLGEIYEQEGEITTALFYYNLCLDLDFEEYETSIHTKARTAIERLSND